jgi:hypothetical protein
MLHSTGKPEVYIYFSELPGAKKAIRRLSKYMTPAGIDMPRFRFPKSELDKERTRNAERIQEVRESTRLPEPIRQPLVDMLESIGKMMESAAWVLEAGERHDKASVLKALKKHGVVERSKEENKQRTAQENEDNDSTE